jgi:hypothetical protein
LTARSIRTAWATRSTPLRTTGTIRSSTRRLRPHLLDLVHLLFRQDAFQLAASAIAGSGGQLVELLLAQVQLLQDEGRDAVLAERAHRFLKGRKRFPLIFRE